MLRTLHIWVCVFAVCLLGAAERLSAQKPAESGSAATTGEPSASAPKAKEAGSPKPDQEDPTSRAGDVVQLKNAQGETIVVPRAVWNEVLSDLESRLSARAADPLVWSVTRVALEGTTEGETAILKATVQIQLLVDNKWVKIPLKLNEGLLQDQSHTGPGESTPGGFDPSNGYLWWLKGKGQHTLTLSLNVPLRKEQPGRRFHLTLPPTAVSDLKLRVNLPRITARVDEQSRARLVVTPTPEGASTIEMVLGLGAPDVDVRWQPQPELGSVETVLQAQTSISAVLDGRILTLDAAQRVVALQGSFNQLQVRLPAGSELLQVRGDHFKEYSLDQKDPSLVLVTLKETVSDTSTPIELKWKVRTELPQQPDKILLQGFDLAKAKLQTGYLAVKVVGDYRLEVADDASNFAHRANLSSLEEALPSFGSLDDVSSTFGFTRQPFQLTLNLRPEKPLVTIKPRLILSLTNDRMELFGEFDLQFYRGRIDDVKFVWPGWKEEGWKIDPVTSATGIQETSLDDPSTVSVKLLAREGTTTPRTGEKPVNGNKSVTLSLHASRMLANGHPMPEFTLPVITDANVQPADFVVVLADSLDADIRPLNDTATRFQSIPQSASITIPKPFKDLRRRDFRLDAARPKFSITTTLQMQRIATSADVDISLDGADVKLTQRISYDVTYERLSQVNLMVPEAWRDRAQYAVSVDDKVTPVTPIDIGGVEGIRKQKRLVLATPLLGRFDVLVTARLPVSIPPGQATNFEIPLVQSSDADVTSTRIRIQKPKRQRLSVDSEGWTPQAPQGGASVWGASTKQSSVVLKMEPSDGAWKNGIAIPRRLVQAVFSPQGEIYCQVQYRLAGYVPVLRLTLPTGASNAKGRWMLAAEETVRTNLVTRAATGLVSADVVEPQLRELPGAAGQFEMMLPEIEADAEHVVTINYQLQRQDPAGLLGLWSTRHVAVPDVLTDATPTQTFWQIQLLDNQDLWTLPAGLIPEFDWQLQSWWWTRFQRQTPQSLRRWIGDPSDSKRNTELTSSGNRYVFSSLDSNASMNFQTLSSALIVLIGGSLFFVFGFILVNVPASRHVLTFLWLGFLTTFISLWYSEPVLVLLQPACLGLGLAVLAALAQRWRTQPRQINPVVTLGTPSDILAAASSEQFPQTPAPDQPPLTETRPAAIVIHDGEIGL